MQQNKNEFNFINFDYKCFTMETFSLQNYNMKNSNMQLNLSSATYNTQSSVQISILPNENVLIEIFVKNKLFFSYLPNIFP